MVITGNLLDIHYPQGWDANSFMLPYYCINKIERIKDDEYSINLKNIKKKIKINLPKGILIIKRIGIDEFSINCNCEKRIKISLFYKNFETKKISIFSESMKISF
jgi:hypothetical protein